MERSVSRKKKTRRNGDLICYTRFAAGDVKAFRKRIFPGSEYSGAALERKSFSQAERKAKRDRALFRRCNRFYRAEKSCGRKDKADISGLKRKTQSLH